MEAKPIKLTKEQKLEMLESIYNILKQKIEVDEDIIIEFDNYRHDRDSHINFGFFATNNSHRYKMANSDKHILWVKKEGRVCKCSEHTESVYEPLNW